MNFSDLPKMSLTLAMMAVLVVTVTASNGAQKVTLTNGLDSVTWQHGPSLDKRDADLSCLLRRGVSFEGSGGHKVVRRSAEAFMADASRCQTHERRRRQIMGGTKWCGAGNEATDYDDLGFYSDVDSCCRDHDHCKRSVRTGKTMYGVTNNTPFTWSDCECDNKFRSCLHTVNSNMGDFVGRLYFNLGTGVHCLQFPTDDPTKAKVVDKGNYASKDKTSDFWSFLNQD